MILHKKIMGYGAKFRIPSKFNINSVLKEFKYNIDTYVYK